MALPRAGTMNVSLGVHPCAPGPDLTVESDLTMCPVHECSDATDRATDPSTSLPDCKGFCLRHHSRSYLSSHRVISGHANPSSADRGFDLGFAKERPASANDWGLSLGMMALGLSLASPRLVLP